MFSALQWLAWTSVMGWFSMFVRLASLRGDALLCSAAAGAPARHARILALLLGILAQDCSWIASYCRTLGDGSARWGREKYSAHEPGMLDRVLCWAAPPVSLCF